MEDVFYKEEARVVQHDAARAAKVTLGMKVHGAGGTIVTSRVFQATRVESDVLRGAYSMMMMNSSSTDVLE